MNPYYELPTGIVKLDYHFNVYSDLAKSIALITAPDLRELSSLCGFSEVAEFQQAHRRWVADSVARERMARDARWSEAIAVGNLSFVKRKETQPFVKL